MHSSCTGHVLKHEAIMRVNLRSDLELF